MPPRLSKRQQREQEELEALAGPSDVHNNSDPEQETEEEHVGLSRKDTLTATGGFAALAGDDDDEEDQASEENKPVPVFKSKKSKKKKKKAAMPSDHDSPTPQRKGVKGKKLKEDPQHKGKLKAEEEDFDKALEALSSKYANLRNSGPAKASATLSSFDNFNSLLSVSLKHLDPDSELRRFFGSKVISSSTPQKPSRTQGAGRSHLARPQQSWPPPHFRAGLSMRALTTEEVDAKGTGTGPDNRERWWTIEAGPRYKATTYEFMQCVMGGDPQLFFNLLQEMPWHADTLLQTAEVFRHREEYSAAADFTSRALFAYERAFAAAFNLTTGIHRLDFDHVESRVFYLALSRNVVDLNRRGTPRTSFEFARLLFALDPHTDPHGALLHLDCLAIKAGQTSWLLDVWDACERIHSLGENDGGETRFDVTLMPGWYWSRALALFERDSDRGRGTSTQALLEAIITFPSIVPLLADKADISMPADLRKLDAFKIVTDYSAYRDTLATSLVHLLSHIYALRSASLWKQPAHAAWLSDTLNSLITSIPIALTGTSVPPARARLSTLFSEQSNLTDALYRHVVVVAPLAPEFRRLMGFFPAEVKERLAQTIEGDPLPPVTAVSTYEEAYFAAVGVEGRGRWGDRLAAELNRVFPDAVDRGQFQALFDAHPQIAERFPGGVVELAQMARQFPHELMEAMLGMVAEDGEHPVDDIGEGVMPGGEAVFAENVDMDLQPVAEAQDADVAEGSEGGEADDDEEEEYDEPILPVRIVQTLLGRLWGRSAPVDSDSDREDGEGEGGQHGEGPRADDVD